MNEIEQAPTRLETTIGLVLLALIAIGCLVVLAPFFSAILWAIVLALATWPLFQRINRAVNGRTVLAATVITLLLGVVIVFPLVLVILSLEENVHRFAGLVREMIAEGLPPPPGWLSSVPVLGPAVLDRWEHLLEDRTVMVAEVSRVVEAGRLWLLQMGLTAGKGLLHLLLSILITFVLYLNGEAVVARLRSGAQRLAGSEAERLLRVAHRTMAGVIYGVLGTALIQAGLIGVGMWVAGVPAVVVLGVLLFFLSLLPIAPLLLVAMVVGWLFAQGAVAPGIALFVWSVAVGLLTESVLKPYLVSHIGGTLPLILILLGMLGGATVFGLLGLFIGPTLLAVGFTLLAEWSAASVGAPSPIEAAGQAPAPGVAMSMKKV
jgi:predicted PurR-regulated permease PerM